MIPEGSYIERVKIAYDDKGVNYFKATTEKFINSERGILNPDDSVYEVVFRD